MNSTLETSDDLDPAIRRFVAETSAAYAVAGPFDQLSFPEQRQLAEQVREPWRRGGPTMARTTEHEVPTPHGAVRVRVYEPLPERPKPALIYLHGGGWTIFSIDTHDRLMREYAARAGVVVIGVDYALSPEVHFPVAMEQVAAVVAWLRDQAAALGVDPERLAIGGDSAGANLSFATALLLRDRGQGETFRALMSIYGAFDTEISADAARRYGGLAHMLSRAELEGFWRNYLSSPTDARNPLARPMLADLRGLPPAFFTVAECDILAEQNLALADKLRAAGGTACVEVYPGATHSFLEAVSIAPIAQRALDDGADWLRTQLHYDGESTAAPKV